MIDSGKLIHRVTWMSATETVASGKITTSYTDMGTFWALVESNEGTESVSHNKVQAQRTHTVTMRYVGIIQQKDKLLFKSRTLQITSVANTEERNVELILKCIEVNN